MIIQQNRKGAVCTEMHSLYLGILNDDDDDDDDGGGGVNNDYNTVNLQSVLQHTQFVTCHSECS